jgi:hypothetical protein
MSKVLVALPNMLQASRMLEALWRHMPTSIGSKRAFQFVLAILPRTTVIEALGKVNVSGEPAVGNDTGG